MAQRSVVKDEFVDLESMPRHRHFSNNPLVERTRLAVPFDTVMFVGLDIDGFGFATFKSVDTDVPPAFFDSYIDDQLFINDPFVVATNGLEDVLTEERVYRSHQPSDRLNYVLEAFGIFNRTYFLIRRCDTVYGGVGFSRIKPFDPDEMAYLEMVSRPLHNAIKKPLMARFAIANLKLSDGELLCLRMGSRGMTTHEIAEHSSYQGETINTYFKTAARKLKTANRVETIAEALRRGLIG